MGGGGRRRGLAARTAAGARRKPAVDREAWKVGYVATVEPTMAAESEPRIGSSVLIWKNGEGGQ